MRKPSTLLLLTFLFGSLSTGCAQMQSSWPIKNEDKQLAEARTALSEAKTAREQNSDVSTEHKFDIAQKIFEDKTLAAAQRYRDAGQWFQAQTVIDQSLQQAPTSGRLLNAKAEIEQERGRKLNINDCRLGAARARYLADKSDLLKQRAPLEAKDYLQDWLSRRERNELDQLGEQLRECAEQALKAERLELAEETVNAAGRARGDDFIASQRAELEKRQKPPPQAAPAPAPPPPQAAKRPAPVREAPAENPQKKIRQLRVALQSAMTRGNLKQAKTALSELRRLEGDTPQLKDLGQSIDEAIAAYIAELNERASIHYRDRQIEQARDLWQEILELDPNNAQARTNLERAERVLKKLEELQGTTPETVPDSKPQTIPPSKLPTENKAGPAS